MASIFAIIFRLFAILFGFLSACVTAAVLYLFLSGLIRSDDFIKFDEVEMAFTLIVTITSLTAYFANIIFVPFAIVICIFEIKAIRDWLIYIIAAALMSLVPLFLVSNLEVDLASASLYAVSAIGGGFIYWLFVGQRAGNWRKK